MHKKYLFALAASTVLFLNLQVALAVDLPWENPSGLKENDPHIRCHRKSDNQKSTAERKLNCTHVLFKGNKFERFYRCVCTPK